MKEKIESIMEKLDSEKKYRITEECLGDCTKNREVVMFNSGIDTAKEIVKQEIYKLFIRGN